MCWSLWGLGIALVVIGWRYKGRFLKRKVFSDYIITCLKRNRQVFIEKSKSRLFCCQDGGEKGGGQSDRCVPKCWICFPSHSQTGKKKCKKRRHRTPDLILLFLKANCLFHKKSLIVQEAKFTFCTPVCRARTLQFRVPSRGARTKVVMRNSINNLFEGECYNPWIFHTEDSERGNCWEKQTGHLNSSKWMPK